MDVDALITAWDIAENIKTQIKKLDKLDISIEHKVLILNNIKENLHDVSPFKTEPVDCVLWIPIDEVQANDYNPNNVAPPEMKLLEHSILSDGYTQPIVSWLNKGEYEVIDGFHRNRVGKECEEVKDRIHGYLPLTVINNDREDRNDRIAATIRHNRARGKHQVAAMSDIVVELKRRNWSDERIGKELGMDPDEVLRLTQITGLAELFSDKAFSEAWEHIGKGEVIPTSEDEEIIDLEWMNSMPRREIPAGWEDRTEQSSVLYGEDGEWLGVVQKSHFNDTWFWYAYTQPHQEGNLETRKSAKLKVEKIMRYRK